MTGRRRTYARIGALVLVVAAATTLLLQVEVGDPTRACGSAFDAVTDRSGWEVWWAQDFDEATVDRPSELVRTRECPDAVNRRTVIAAVLGLSGALLAASVWRPAWRAEGTAPLARIGAMAAATGVVLTIGGIAGIVLLVADADSTLFLYTDRLVVGVIGLIALVPAIALAIGGWALRTAAGSEGREESDDPAG